MLTYDLEKRENKPLYEFLYLCIRQDICSGKIRPFEKLPSKRSLAEHLRVSIITVKNAYEQLLAEGYITSCERKGYYASDIGENTINNLQGKIDNMSNTTESEEETNNTTNTATVEENNFAVLELSPVGGIAVLYNGEVYVRVDDSTVNIDYIYGDGKYQTLVKTRESYSEYQFGSLTVNNNSNKWLKLNVSNVKAIYNNEYGQDISSTNPKYGIIMLNEDNTVSYISIPDLIEGKTETIKLDANNITDVVSEDNNGYTTYFVDNNGNKEDVNNYIK